MERIRHRSCQKHFRDVACSQTTLGFLLFFARIIYFDVCYLGGPVKVQLSLHVREILLNENDMVGTCIQQDRHKLCEYHGRGLVSGMLSAVYLSGNPQNVSLCFSYTV